MSTCEQYQSVCVSSNQRAVPFSGLRPDLAHIILALWTCGLLSPGCLEVGVALRDAVFLRFRVQGVVPRVLCVRARARLFGDVLQVVGDALVPLRRVLAVRMELVAFALGALLDGVAVDDLAVQLVAGLLPGECGITFVIVRV